jgi:hypothetical protein
LQSTQIPVVPYVVLLIYQNNNSFNASSILPLSFVWCMQGVKPFNKIRLLYAINIQISVILQKTPFMKKNIVLLLIFTAVLVYSKQTRAQDYTVAAGLRFSYEYGPVGKYFINKTDAIEAEFGLRSHGAVLTGLWERHIALADQLKLYYGFGGHIGGVGNNDNPRYNKTILVGADGVVGLDYLIPNSPIALSLDLNPRFELSHGPYFDLSPGVGLKYVWK